MVADFSEHIYTPKCPNYYVFSIVIRMYYFSSSTEATEQSPVKLR